MACFVLNDRTGEMGCLSTSTRWRKGAAENATRRIEHLCHKDRVVWDQTEKPAGARAADQARMPVEALEEESDKGEEDSPNKSTNLRVSDT